MSDIPPIQQALRPAEAGSIRQAAPARVQSETQAADRVEISEFAQMLSTLDPNTEIRVEKVAEIREAILNGTYETEEKLSATVDRLMDVLKGA